MIPDFDGNGNMPIGIVEATIAEIKKAFAEDGDNESENNRRRWLFEGLCKLLKELKEAGCKTFWLDGSFITHKERPKDYDGCFDKAEVSVEMKRKLFPAPLDYEYCRHCQLEEYRGEVRFAFEPYEFNQKENRYINYLEFFQQDDRIQTKKIQKGILKIDLTKEFEP